MHGTHDVVIARLDSARTALQEAKTIQATKKIVDVAAAAEIYAKRQELGEDAIGYAHEIKTEALAQLGVLLSVMEKQSGGRGLKGGGRNRGSEKEPQLNAPPTLSDLGIDKKTSMIAQQLAALDVETRGEIAKRETTLQDVRREQKEEKREKRREENTQRIEVCDDPRTLDAQFATIVMDPPWDWGDEGDVDQLGRSRPTYGTMPLAEIQSLPIPALSDEDCHLYLWITNRSLPKGFGLLEQWGFRYITCITWVKPSFGMGNYFRGSTEQVLFGVKGSQPLKRKDAATHFLADRGVKGHSSKPLEFYELVETCSPGPYLEMFSRHGRDGWTMWGADA